jgi:hypothetical protein
MRKLDPAQIEYAFNAVEAAYKGLKMGVEQSGGIKDPVMRDLYICVGNLCNGLSIFLEIIPHRLESLHQKVDRIEKKIGSVK